MHLHTIVLHLERSMWQQAVKFKAVMLAMWCHITGCSVSRQFMTKFQLIFYFQERLKHLYLAPSSQHNGHILCQLYSLGQSTDTGVKLKCKTQFIITAQLPKTLILGLPVQIWFHKTVESLLFWWKLYTYELLLTSSPKSFSQLILQGDAYVTKHMADVVESKKKAVPFRLSRILSFWFEKLWKKWNGTNLEFKNSTNAAPSALHNSTLQVERKRIRNK